MWETHGGEIATWSDETDSWVYCTPVPGTIIHVEGDSSSDSGEDVISGGDGTYTPAPWQRPIDWQDEGVGLGPANIVNFVGDAVEATLEDGTLTVAVGAVGGGGTGNGLLSGGGVSWIIDLDFHVQAATYLIQGVLYSSAATDVTLDAADPTNPRIDVIAVDATGAVVVLTGVPAATPERPDIDPATQLDLTFIYIPATATEPGIELDIIYRENGEWTSSQNGGHFTLASTNNPYAGSVDIEGTGVVSGNYVQFAAPAPFDTNNKDSLLLRIRSKAAWPSQKQLNITWRQSGTQRGNAVVLKQGTFGFESSNTTDYQLIQIPLTSFGAGGANVNQLRIACAGSGSAIGCYLDNLEMQTGILVAAPDSTRMRWRGDYTAATAYAVNDVVLHDCVQYVCVTAGAGNTPSEASTFWQEEFVRGWR